MQRQQLLGVLDAQGGLDGALGFGQGGLGSGHVQFDQLFNAFESLGGQAEQGFEVCFLSGEDLVSGQGHLGSPGRMMGWSIHVALRLVVHVAVQHVLKYRQLNAAIKRFLLLCSNLEAAF
ncbi:hypothetical protein FQZ97_819960 [compost metagenome]